MIVLTPVTDTSATGPFPHPAPDCTSPCIPLLVGERLSSSAARPLSRFLYAACTALPRNRRSSGGRIILGEPDVPTTALLPVTRAASLVSLKFQKRREEVQRLKLMREGREYDIGVELRCHARHAAPLPAPCILWSAHCTGARGWAPSFPARAAGTRCPCPRDRSN